MNLLADILNLVLSHGYFVLLLLMFIEGPLVAFAAAFAAALDVFNVWIIFFLFIIGNQLPDIIIFKIAEYSRVKTIERFISSFGMTKKRIKWLEKNIKRHFIKSTILTKTIPPLPVPGIILSGFLKVPFKKFFWTYLFFNTLWAVIFVSLGYYSGLVANLSLKYFKLGEWLLPVAAVLIVALYLLMKKYAPKLAKIYK